MPITLITASPGGGKTALCVSMIVEAVASGRNVYVDGIPDLDVSHEPLDNAQRWHEPGVVDDGALIVIDEVQRYWRPKASGAAVPPDIQALETHRHRGLDFILITQGPALVHTNVRALVGRHIHLRNVGVLGRWWYEWPEIGEPDRFKSAPIKRRYKLPTKVFSRYKSASLHVKPTRPIPPSLIVAGLALVVLGIGAWYVKRSVDSKVAASAPAASAPAARGASAPARSAAVVPARVAPGGPTWRPVTDEPYDGLGLHVVGQLGDYLLFAVTVPHLGSRPIAYLSSAQLLRVGYSVRVDGPCSVRLTFDPLPARRVTCDQPAQAAPRGPGGGAGVVPPLPAASAPLPGLV